MTLTTPFSSVLTDSIDQGVTVLSPSHERRVLWALLLFLGFFLLVCYRGYFLPDGAHFLRETQVFVETGQLGHDDPHNAAQYVRGTDGKYYARLPESGVVLTMAPFYLVAREATSLVPEHLKNDVLWFVVSLHAVVFTLLGSWLLFRIGRFCQLPIPTVVIGVILFVISTPMLNCAGKLYREPLLVAAQLGVVLVLLGFVKSKPSWTSSFYAIFGVALLGIARLPSAAATIAAILFCSVVIFIQGQRDLARRLVLAGALAIIGILAAYWLLNLWVQLFAPGLVISEKDVSGGILEEAFTDVSGSEAYWEWAARSDTISGWWVPLKRFAGMFVAPGCGMLWYSAAVIIGIVTALKARKDMPLLAWFSTGFLLAYVAGYSLANNWFSGAWGIRYIIPGTPLLCLFAGWAFARWLSSASRLRKGAAAALLVLLCYIGVVGAVVSDRPIIPNAPSGQPLVTRYEQAWNVEYMPLYFHTVRFFSPNFSVMPEELATNAERLDKQSFVLDGYVVWWTLAYRAGVLDIIPLLAGVLLLGCTLISGVWLKRLTFASNASGAAPH